MVTFNINIGRKEAVFFVAFFAVTLGIGVWASSHEAPSPGHSADSVWIDSLGKTLEQAVIDGDFGGGVDYLFEDLFITAHDSGSWWTSCAEHVGENIPTGYNVCILARAKYSGPVWRDDHPLYCWRTCFK
jgi:hypothetical protein